MSFLRIFLIGLALSGCAVSGPDDPAPPGFDVTDFFSGETRGDGSLLFRNGEVDQTFTVESTGGWQDDVFVLDQTISWSDGDTQKRSFALERVGAGQFEGTLNGTASPVRLTVEGEVATLRHALPNVPFGRMEQHMTISVDGARLDNRGTARVLGITVRRLEETIEKAGY